MRAASVASLVAGIGVKMGRNCLLYMTALVLLGLCSCNRESEMPGKQRQVVETWPSGRPRYVLLGDPTKPPFIGQEYYESGVLKSRWRFDTEGAGTADEYDSGGHRIRHIVFREGGNYADVWFRDNGGRIRFFSRYRGMLLRRTC